MTSNTLSPAEPLTMTREDESSLRFRAESGRPFDYTDADRLIAELDATRARLTVVLDRLGTRMERGMKTTEMRSDIAGLPMDEDAVLLAVFTENPQFAVEAVRAWIADAMALQERLDWCRAERTAVMHALVPECPAYPGQPNKCDEDMCDYGAADAGALRQWDDQHTGGKE